MKNEKLKIKPFLKWAGGKRQLIPIITENLPDELINGEIETFIEPFVGGGAVLFELLKKYDFKKVIINDLNKELMNTYMSIRDNTDELVSELKTISEEYLLLDDEKRKEYFYKIRDIYNSENLVEIKKSAYFIFLNRTCFNGLYRVNRNGKFNVPHGKYKNPKILDKENILIISKVLKEISIYCVDFEEVYKLTDDKTFVYFDPPYRPLNATSSFSSYHKNEFNDDEQIRLVNFYKKLDSKGAKLMLSNSDPKNINKEDEFFDKLYRDYKIIRVDANRSINSNGDKRGKIKEILVTNY